MSKKQESHQSNPSRSLGTNNISNLNSDNNKGGLKKELNSAKKEGNSENNNSDKVPLVSKIALMFGNLGTGLMSGIVVIES